MDMSALNAAGHAVPQIPIDVKWHISDSVIAKEMVIPAGAMMGKEIHDYSHLSHLQSGQAVLLRESGPIPLQAPAWVNIEADQWHALEAVTDIVWVCIHSARETGVPHA